VPKSSGSVGVGFIIRRGIKSRLSLCYATSTSHANSSSFRSSFRH